MGIFFTNRSPLQWIDLTFGVSGNLLKWLGLDTNGTVGITAASAVSPAYNPGPAAASLVELDSNGHFTGSGTGVGQIITNLLVGSSRLNYAQIFGSPTSWPYLSITNSPWQWGTANGTNWASMGTNGTVPVTVQRSVTATSSTNFFGQLSPTNFNGGTSASGTTYLAGDGTWKPALVTIAFTNDVNMNGYRLTNGGGLRINDTGTVFAATFSGTGTATNLTFNNPYDSSIAQMNFWMRTAGTPLNVLKIWGQGEADFMGPVICTNGFSGNLSGNASTATLATNAITATNLAAALDLSKLDWSKASSVPFINLNASRVPAFTNSGVIYYLILSTNAP
jgi:hypothetical protein